MFFVCSKIVGFLFTPFLWIVALLVFGLLTKNEIRKRRAYKWSVILLLFFSNSFIFDEAVRLWEVKAIPQGSLHQYDAAIVLGGATSWDPSLQRIQFYRAGDRLFQALELYKKGIVKKIVFTGGSGSVLHPEYKEGERIATYLRSIGIPDSAFIIENDSKNTYENAVMTKKLLDREMPGGKFLLVTSGIHLRRAKACFDKAGLPTLCYSTDRYSGPRKFEFEHLIIPDPGTMEAWSVLIHEMIGYATYKVAGYL